MASIAIMIGGALINATALVGGSYLAKYLRGDKNSVEEEKKRHDLAVEKYQAAYEKYQENRTKLLDWIAANNRIKKETNQNFVDTDYALKLYNEAHSEELDMKKSHFSNFYKPSTQQKQEGGERRATDPIWSLKVFNIEKALVNEKEPVLYYLKDGPKRGFVREELQIVPPKTELPPEGIR
ncbi:hypothetical protein AWC38_SpisGene16954 [Stylophora pistillata]|uniref:Uncharacterized protein n=1 Tax=Stylophora pistillata TaxID=50429 RepID=A0A2B4RQN6_STYPI|nr:hypothetical protein AWC38_SpisGene16954 [Stylophora pistillata]